MLTSNFLRRGSELFAIESDFLFETFLDQLFHQKVFFSLSLSLCIY